MSPVPLAREVGATVERWQQDGMVRRLWDRDPTLWTDSGEEGWLGWLDAAAAELAGAERLEALAREVAEAGFEHALLLGMGGSSLCPETLSRTFGPQVGFPELHVLDSTDPAEVGAAEGRVDLRNTLVIVSSKSGTTLEPNILLAYFYDRVAAAVSETEAPRRFVAITDPGSELEALARERGFRHVAHGVPAIGGRYSALSDFGMLPAAVMGLDVRQLLGGATEMARRCGPGTPVPDNPGLALGAAIGACANAGRDKLTLVASPAISDLGAWLEQLVAESTGKQGRGVIPIDREPLGSPEVYGDDRLFVHLKLTGEAGAEQDEAVDAIEAAGHPVVRIELRDLGDIGAELFRWQFATAVAGSIIGINPFDQPDVEASKVATRELTAAFERTGLLPAEEPIAVGGGMALFADERNAQELRASAGGDDVEALLAAHLARIGAGDYVALLAYLERSEGHEATLEAARLAVRDRTRAATCVGFGPRFLHSTGQAYKGGPPSGVFCQITCDDARDLPVPGRSYTFGLVKAAQARGDFQVLAERGRRALRIHIGDDVAGGLDAVRQALERALR